MSHSDRAIPTTAAQAEESLVSRLRAGEEAAFEEVVREYGGALLGLARRLLGNAEDAQEALQEAFLSAFRKLDQFTGASRFSTWLHRIVVNASLMKLRKRRSRPEVSIERLLPGYMKNGHHLDPPAPWKDRAEVMLQREETRHRVRESIDELPEKYRTVLQLRDIEGLNTEETAELLELEIGAVKTRLHRARQALRTLLDPHMREGQA